MERIIWQRGTTLRAIKLMVTEAELQCNQGNKTLTASNLGISVRTLDGIIEEILEQKKESQAMLDRAYEEEQDFIFRSRGIPRPEPVQEVEPEPEKDKSGIQVTDLNPKRKSK